MGEKTPKYTKYVNKGKKIPVWLPSHHSVYKNGGRLFPVSENTENKPDLL